MEPRIDILPPAQRALLHELHQTPPHFVLYGGTAIALHLGHRQSADFDFFSNEPFNPDFLYRKVPYLTGSEVYLSDGNTLCCMVNREGTVRVSFFGGLPLNRVGEPDSVLGFRIAALEDLLATKLKVIVERAEMKDYIDIAALLEHGLDLSYGLSAARCIYGPAFNGMLALKALVSFADGELPQLPEIMRKNLMALVQKVDIAKLPSVNCKMRLQ